MIVKFEKGRKGDPVARLQDGSTGLVDRNAKRRPAPGETWEVEVVGRSRNVAFLRPIRTAEEAAAATVLEWAGADPERTRFIEANGWDAHPPVGLTREELDRGFARSQKERQAAQAVQQTLGAEVERLIGLIQAGAETPAPARPQEPETPVHVLRPVEVFSAMDGQDALIVEYAPGQGRPWRITTAIREHYRRGGGLVDPSEIVARRESIEGVDEWFSGHRLADAWQAARSHALEAAAELERQAAENANALQRHQAALAEWRQAMEAWRAASERNRLADLHERGWLNVEEWEGRPWLWAVLPETGDTLPVKSLEQLRLLLEE